MAVNEKRNYNIGKNTGSCFGAVGRAVVSGSSSNLVYCGKFIYHNCLKDENKDEMRPCKVHF